MIHTQVKFRKEDYLYIAKVFQWKRENLVVPDTGYLSGSKEELLALLEEKRIQKG